ncbi:MAG: cobalamin biosynthesis protein CbiM [Deltaproteobacteria bacterium]|nr:MAG: cobalamin biosynthesis protein CbiM [Deltaproteobacteria bacterium]PIE73311.1 MAG: cobalamin biosynthesis protein CbiM [Deltaproteobacteria bacterium]
MHISEGVLSTQVLAAGGLVAAAGTAVGLKKMDYDSVMTTALLTATFFVAGLIHIPVGPGSVHLVLGGLIGLVLGWGCFPAILTALLLQSIFFQYGGLVVLGVNTSTMALPALICSYLFRPWLKHQGARRQIAAFSCGFVSMFLSCLLMALALATTDKGFIDAAWLVVSLHLPVMVVEGCITMFVVIFLVKVEPDILALEGKHGI